MGDPSHDKSCEVCHAKVAELRRGRCWGCYSRWTEARPVGVGAACCICNERRRDNLRMVELLRAWMPMCHNCAAKATVLAPMPQTMDELRRRLARDRRAADRRAGTKPDDRVFKRERRGLERRAMGLANGDDLMLLDEDDILMIEELSELTSEDGGDETRIVDLLPPKPSPMPRRGRFASGRHLWNQNRRR